MTPRMASARVGVVSADAPYRYLRAQQRSYQLAATPAWSDSGVTCALSPAVADSEVPLTIRARSDATKTTSGSGGYETSVAE